MNEITIKGTVVPAQFNVNFDEVNKMLDTMLDSLKGRAVTADSLKADKQDAKKLASLRVSIDKYRKERKKEAEATIKDFEDKCKCLVTKVQQVEKPLNDQIEAYNDLVRQEKKAYAEETIGKAIIKFGLDPKRAARLAIKPEYLNLTQTKKFVAEDVENEAVTLKIEQDKEAKILADALALINVLNETVEQKQSLDDFKTITDYAIANPLDDNGWMAAKIRESFKKIQDAEAEVAKKAAEKAKEEIKAKANAESVQTPATNETEVSLPENTAEDKHASFASSKPAPKWTIAVNYIGTADDLKNLSRELQTLCQKYNCTYNVDESRSHIIRAAS